ncbi:MAG: bifunctional methylenetetrahydrofolate dehydrogenase/methenyltetrahydrofolate cyclohydrolase FolD [Legionella sp.]|nr:bifunctional methylenetetrahydrofolate dehydrogenase/methenyltetrahydrofolate cyclohydrolase FolD [Legionella sp.]
MTASLLDGKKVATEIKRQLKDATRALEKQKKDLPGLAVILIGDDPASRIYVNNKRKACFEVGLNSYDYNLPTSTDTQVLFDLIDELNQSPKVHGILVQLPLPKHVDTAAVIERIHPHKDVDGFHPENIGRLALNHPFLRPCTPYGIMRLLDAYSLSPRGKHAVVVGASNIVGRPMMLEFLRAGATVTICHSLTQDLRSHIERGEIIVVATGKQDLISPTWLKPNHIIIDVGIHRSADGCLRGDISFHEAKDKVAWITPVPGGVGPMTIATLLDNTWQAYVFQSSECKE